MNRLVNPIQHIYLADDDNDDSLLFKEALSTVGHDIKLFLANDGQELLDQLHVNLPDAIFLDLNMPGKNGFECLQEIRATDRFDHIPVVMYSTSERKKDIEACYDKGANYYLVKPCSYSGIVYVLHTLLHSKLKQDDLTPDLNNFVLKAN